MVNIYINGKEVAAQKGETILQVALREGYDIPHLCYHPALKAEGNCRLCLVEAAGKIVTSCTTVVKDGLEVNLDTEEVNRHRRTVLEMLKGLVPKSPLLNELSIKYGLEKVRIAESEEVCIKCGLCVRVCSDLIGADALTQEGRGTETFFNPPFGEPSPDCVGCTSCAFICPVQCIKYEKTDDTITIWGKTMDRLKCSNCNAPLDLTQEHLDLIVKRGDNLHAEDLMLCDVCSRAQTLSTMKTVVESQLNLE
ncbi:MAG: (2Fe-2S)-binding protein [Deltaproteobacteria bacterium]|nr:(2Fe-2S)-binding protein [Deltaproteobacteria bacterium]